MPYDTCRVNLPCMYAASSGFSNERTSGLLFSSRSISFSNRNSERDNWSMRTTTDVSLRLWRSRTRASSEMCDCRRDCKTFGVIERLEAEAASPSRDQRLSVACVQKTALLRNTSRIRDLKLLPSHFFHSHLGAMKAGLAPMPRSCPLLLRDFLDDDQLPARHRGRRNPKSSEDSGIFPL